MGGGGCGDNPADILSRKRTHLNVKKINPLYPGSSLGEIEVKLTGLGEGECQGVGL